MSGKHPLVQIIENAQLRSDIPAFADQRKQVGQESR